MKKAESLGEASASAEQGEGELDHQAAREHSEALGGVAATDDLKRPLPGPLQRTNELVARITAVGEQVAQPWEPVADRLDEIDRPATALNAGSVDGNEQHQAERVGDDVTLASHNLLARIVAPRAATLGGIGALTNDHPGAGASLAPLNLAGSHHQQVVDRMPQATVAQGAEIALNRRDRREIPGQHPPLATICCHIMDRVHNLAQAGAARSAARLRGRQQRLDQCPLSTAQIAWITQPQAAILLWGGIGPHHLFLGGFWRNSGISDQQHVSRNQLIYLNYF